MNVYDQAHNLSRAIKESEEYKQYIEQKKIIDANPQLKEMIDDFQQKQVAVQAAQMTGQQVSPEDMANVQQILSIIMSDPVAANYIQCQMRFALMMQDVFGILNEAVNPDGAIMQ